MSRRSLVATLFAVVLGAACQIRNHPAVAAAVDGTWLIDDRVALETFPCNGLLCGKIVWLRNPALRTSGMCNRTIVWNLTPAAVNRWTDGWFFDPEDGATYNVNASLETPETMTARIYRGLTIFGRTETLTRIRSGSRVGWCSNGVAD